MSFRKLTASFATALMFCSFGCARSAAPSAPDGSLELILTRSEKRETAHGSLRISGMDRAFVARVALPNDSEPTRVELPPGLYSVEWQAAIDAASDTELAAESTVSVVVVASGDGSRLRIDARALTPRAPMLALR